MSKTRVRPLMAFVLACGLILTSTSLFAQVAKIAQPRTKTLAPIGPPTSVHSQSLAVPNGPLPRAHAQAPRLGGTTIGQNYDGVDYYNANCGCYPPDTNAAVGNNYVVEAVNTQIRVFDKTTGAILLDEPLSVFFGAASGGDPYVLYDDNANRWYVNAFDSSDSGLFLAVSNDGNPLHGFTTYDLTAVGGFPDYAKPGFNKDAIFIGYNDFGSNGGYAAIAAIDKAQLLAGHLVYYTSYPEAQFRAIPPAQMHGDLTGGTEWFVSVLDSGGNTVRVTKMTNYLSNNPQYTYTELPVKPFLPPYYNAVQPGGYITVFPNTTTTQVQYHKGRLVTAQASSTAGDGFGYIKGLFYQISVAGPHPVLMQEGLIDPGFGVSVQMVTVDQDSTGGLGLTWMESSANEYLSMWVGTRPAIYPYGWINGTQSAPGTGFMYANGRIGDYSSTVLDSDGKTFWSANEYIGTDPNDYWLTHITSFHK